MKTSGTGKNTGRKKARSRSGERASDSVEMTRAPHPFRGCGAQGAVRLISRTLGRPRAAWSRRATAHFRKKHSAAGSRISALQSLYPNGLWRENTRISGFERGHGATECGRRRVLSLKDGERGRSAHQKRFHTSSRLVGACTKARLVQKMDFGLRSQRSMRQ
jgi:hypothetical protein